MKEKKPATPLLKQFYRIKAQYPDSLLLYRVGDFYETFGEDAIIASKVLGIVLTRRASGKGSYIELAGVPHHALESYLPKLVQAGYKVAVCDQLEDPKFTKKLVKRGVTELVTPGVAYNDTFSSRMSTIIWQRSLLRGKMRESPCSIYPQVHSRQPRGRWSILKIYFRAAHLKRSWWKKVIAKVSAKDSEI